MRCRITLIWKTKMEEVLRADSGDNCHQVPHTRYVMLAKVAGKDTRTVPSWWTYAPYALHTCRLDPAFGSNMSQYSESIQGEVEPLSQRRFRKPPGGRQRHNFEKRTRRPFSW